MDLLNAAGTVPYDQRAIPSATGTVGWATGGNPGAGIQPTDDDPGHYNSMMEEAKNLIEGAGLTLSAEDNTLWLQAVNLLAAAKAAAGRVPPVFAKSAQGVALTANYAGTVSASFTAPVAGFVFAYIYTNVGTVASAGSLVASTLSINGTSYVEDATTSSQSHFFPLAVTAGETVTVTNTVAVNATAPNTTCTYAVGAFFIPYP